jgi:hypothetical protein
MVYTFHHNVEIPHNDARIMDPKMQHCKACKCNFTDEWATCPKCRRSVAQAHRLVLLQNIGLSIGGFVLAVVYVIWLFPEILT